MTQLVFVLIPTLIILVSVVSDLRTKKVKNQLVLIMAAIALIAAVGLDGWKAIPWSFLSLTTAFLLGLPLFMVGALGAGDIKVYMAFAIMLSWPAVVTVGVYSLIWGAVFGVLRSLIAGQGKTLVSNTWGILRYQKRPEQTTLHYIPFTVALFFGWASYLVGSNINLWGLS